ncbi:hypothetical protein [Sphingomonas sp.]|jgi:hypothetical protein|nr:hypothetical protein [Sphingomonas sp.]MBA4761178.1 hypothetical protein [Sphingomonas sp.]
MRDVLDGALEPLGDAKLAYVTPDLIEAGKIGDVTLSNGNGGGDLGYS